ncbi:MAG: hypothetical protein HY321_04455, partial [Armatimonadetes bacterium]|nr:hypothetical protein [Armatimonadota bacterium]
DWEGVDLTLVSGRPISFVEDLYTPLFLPRPQVQTERYASLRPQTYAEGMEKAEEARPPDLARMPRVVGKGSMRPAPGAAAGAGGTYGKLLPQGIKAIVPYEIDNSLLVRGPDQALAVWSAATGQEVGELFSYHVKTPATLRRRTSAMLPIIGQAVGARKVSIYNAAVLATHPLNGVWLTNDSGASLLGGPITVLEGGTYAGDAQIGNLSTNDRRLLSYAVDLKVTVDPSASQKQQVAATKIARGVLTLTWKTTFSQTYTIKNKADAERTVVVEHPAQPERKLVQPAEPTEKTPGVYRFEVAVAPGKTGKLEVREEQTMLQAVELLPLDVDALKQEVARAEISPKTRDALAEAIRRKTALAEAERQVNELQERTAAMRKDQAEVRNNMMALNRQSQGYQRFEEKLLAMESQIEALQKELEGKRTAMEQARKALEDYLSTLDVGA